MTQEILVNVTPREVRVALLESGVLQEIYIERSVHQGLIGNIYKGRVSRLLPGIQAAFVDIGLDRSAFLHIADMHNTDRAGEIVADMANADIRNFLSAGQELLVQVYKEPLGSKGARLTTQFSIPSRYLVLTHGIFQNVVSQKITDEAERARLLAMLTPGPHGGYIFRTLAEGVTEAELAIDKKFLDALWMEVETNCRQSKAIVRVYEEIPIVLRVLRDLVGYSQAKIQVDDLATVEQMRAYARQYMPALAENISFYDLPQPIFDSYFIEEELQKALERKVPLASGGHLVFDQTEAMTTVDVNTGSYIGQHNLEQTIFKTNLEAVDVIARQVRLRNLGGIIIIDFIDMTDPLHQEQLLSALNTALAHDSVKTQVSEISSLGLVQMTRKRTHESVEHILCEACPTCQSRGTVKSLQTVCYEIFRELKRAAYRYPWGGFVVCAAAEVVAELLNEEAAMLEALETEVSKPIRLQTDNFYGRERFNILPMPDKERNLC
jgi:ribonuclease G